MDRYLPRRYMDEPLQAPYRPLIVFDRFRASALDTQRVKVARQQILRTILRPDDLVHLEALKDVGHRRQHRAHVVRRHAGRYRLFGLVHQTDLCLDCHNDHLRSFLRLPFNQIRLFPSSFELLNTPHYEDAIEQGSFLQTYILHNK